MTKPVVQIKYHNHTCYDEIGPCPHIINIILDKIVNTIGKVYGIA